MKHHTTFTDPAEIITARRNELSLNQTEVARKLGLKNPNFISMVESGKSAVPLSRAVQFAEVLEMDPTWFIERLLSFEPEGQKPEASLRAVAEFLFDPKVLQAALNRRKAEEAGTAATPKPTLTSAEAKRMIQHFTRKRAVPAWHPKDVAELVEA